MPTPVNRFDLDSQTALLERVRAGDSIRAAGRAMGFAEITVFKRRGRDQIFKAALIEAQAVGKQTKAARVWRNTRQVLASLTGEPARVGEGDQVVAPSADPVLLPQRRPSDALRAMVGAITGEPPAVTGKPIGRVDADGVLRLDVELFLAAMLPFIEAVTSRARTLPPAPSA